MFEIMVKYETRVPEVKDIAHSYQDAVKKRDYIRKMYGKFKGYGVFIATKKS